MKLPFSTHPRFLDKILLGLAGVSLAAIGIIFLTDDSVTAYPAKAAGSPAQGEVFLPQAGGGMESDGEMVTYGHEIDEAIEKYFDSLRQNPQQAEEETRIVEGEEEDGHLQRKNQELFQNIDVIKESDLQEKLIAEPSVTTDENGIISLAKKEEGDARSATVKKEENGNRQAMVSHKVAAGESLWRISQKYGIPVYTILSANPDKKEKMIHPGDELKIPPAKGVYHRVKAGETLSVIASKYNTDLKSLRNTNGIAGSHLTIGRSLFIPGARPLPEFKWIDRNRFIWPLAGRLTSTFGWRVHPFKGNRQFHPGIDLGASWGTPVRAAADGLVVFAGKAGAYGNLIIVRHKDGFLTAYAHCSKLLARKGAYVKQGNTIGKVGSTGTSTGPHLHFEVKQYKKNLNPFSALKTKTKVKISVTSG